MQYTIESRELTYEETHRDDRHAGPQTTTVEASDAASAIGRFLVDSRSELVSLTRPVPGREAIATVKKDEAMFLVRIYENGGAGNGSGD